MQRQFHLGILGCLVFLFLPLRVGAIEGVAGSDSFKARTVISGSHVVLGGSFAGASGETGDPDQSPSVWWSWKAPESGPVILRQVCKEAPGASILVSTGTNIASLNSVQDYVTRTFLGRSRVGSFNASAGVTYQMGLYYHFGSSNYCVDLTLTNYPAIVQSSTDRAVSPGEAPCLRWRWRVRRICP